MNYIVQPLGDQAVRMEMEDSSPPIRSICAFLTSHPLKGVVDIVGGLSSVTIFYEYPATNFYSLKEHLAALLENFPEDNVAAFTNTRTVYLPTLYDGPDLSQLSSTHNMTEETIIRLHTGGTYEVTMLGFLPGFPYLTGLPESLETPRLSTPRGKVEAGSVGIGGNQTGVYPIASPGGWNLIGRTPIPLFSPGEKEPFLLQAGDTVRFQAISEKEYNEWLEKVQQQTDWKKEVIDCHEEN
ncbi:5-oxoprolinase subunit PxpB [Sutcliffiella deserti]|uniref:5-oxoprolinase subunit PxpB n=1 Tax=Sutcliffiella deserti TaxID=2875501 RepID=UPI001CC0CFC1|nr:5-oxoprolinase subunit PxpB [Sutcliffiella deserti]